VSSCENIARAKESKVHHAALGLQEKEKCSKRRKKEA
jgi:hypothetical protein